MEFPVCVFDVGFKIDENAAVATGIEAVTVRYIEVMVFVITDVLLTLNSTRADSFEFFTRIVNDSIVRNQVKYTSLHRSE